ncbi:MAG TPA: hybrid sensor histidine kinase/response regulator [Bryobacteraceae bacterium]|nr:hybrid sensor histidine kinase/response regulator [Bryobacteraceae bacterium]
MQDLDVIREFLVESHENLSRLDQELVELEKHPKDADLLASIFRTIHTIKGTCGFLAFSSLERITHQAESLLSQLRDGQRELTPSLVSLILETVDATRKVLAAIEASGEEGPDRFEDLTERLRAAAQLTDGSKGRPGPGMLPGPLAEISDGNGASEPPEGKKPEEDAAKSSAVADANIRVGVGLLDKLMDLVGELVLTRNQILQFNTEREDAALNATSQRLNLITTELQEGVMKTRMQPIGMVWNKLPRVVRDMALSLGKQIRLDMDGTETELDRTIIEAIKDPLVHLVRNSCDHGIEPPEARTRAGKPPEGKLTLRAYHEGGQVNIEIGDDGAGIDVARVKRKAVEKGLLRPEQAEKLSDREALNLIFQPGFSTAQSVTNVSGRGVGMDVVKSHIEKIGGIVDVFSRPGEGATVKLKIPLTLAIIPGLVITSGGERFVIPQVSLLELIRLEGDSSEKHIERVHGTPVYRRRGSLLPIAYLNQVLGLKSAERAEAVSMVVLQAEDRQFGLVVDGINDTQEIVVKPLGKQLKGLTVYAGATIMGDGRVALILDVLGIGQRSGVLAESREQARAAAEQKTQSGIEQQRLLLFRAGSFERLAVPLSLVARLEEFPQNTIEHAGGCQVVQYRNRILPLVPLRAVLESDAPDHDQMTDPVQVVVFNDGDRSVGLVVDQILDVAEEAVTVRQKSGRKGLLGSAVVGKRVTDFLDLNHVIHAAAEDWFRGTGGPANGKRVLVAEASAFSRGLIRSGLDMAGYRVREAANLDEAVRGLEQHPVDVVVASLDLPPNGSSALLDVMRRRPEWQGIPILALADSAEQVRARAGQPADFEDCQVKFDREAMLESVARLASALASAETAPVCAGEER